VEDVTREDRKQGNGPAEEHGEQIEQERAEQHALASHEADAREEIVASGVRHKLPHGRAVSHHVDPADRHDHQHGVRRVRERRAAECIEHPANGGTDDGRELPCRSTPRDGVRIHSARNEFCAEGDARGHQETARYAADDDDRVDAGDSRARFE
jgi:hypothetical protein